MLLFLLVIFLVYLVCLFTLAKYVTHNFTASLFFSVIVTLLTLSFVVYYFKDKALFLPDDSPFTLEVEEHVFGPDLSGFLYPNSSTQKVILYSHGNGGNASHYVQQVEELSKEANVFVYDYPGYGRSTGTPSEEKLFESGLAAYDYLKSLGFEEIYVYGYSLGGAVTVEIASQRDVKGVVLQSTFARISDVIPGVGRIFAGRDFNTLYKLNKLPQGVPVIVAHSPGDEVVPYSSGLQLYNSIPSDEKSWYQLPGGHFTLLDPTPRLPYQPNLTLERMLVEKILPVSGRATLSERDAYYDYVFQTLGIS